MDTRVSADAPPMAKKSGRLKSYLAIGTAVLASYGAVYGLGYFRGHDAVLALESQNQQLIRELSDTKAAAKKQVALEMDRNCRLEARRNLGTAIESLDSRNFGIAQKSLEQFAQWLTRGHADGKLSDLGKAVGGFRLVATEDLSAQRQKLIEYQNQFDQMVPATNP